jgi:N-acetyl-gamma-glutamyl-phosphate/LysW-gamma-L-alpha-aminoadipyl-6-phosphate reductase
MKRSIHVAILGASGYGAGELLRLFTQHPRVQVVSATSTSRAGQPLAELHPHLRGFYDLRTSEAVDFEQLVAGTDAVLFSALPRGASGATLHALLSRLEGQAGFHRLRVIDLSGDFRLTDARQHARFYAEAPLLPERRGAFVYGLPELSRAHIRTARYIANPGCLATASILAAAPLATNNYTGLLAINAVTGSSGAGRQLKETTHHPTRHADFRAYEPLCHQHEPEIRQALGDPHGERLQTSFVAHSMDTARGIFVTLHALLPEPLDESALRRRYTDFYKESPFVRVVAGSPALQNVAGSNFCDIGLATRERQVIVMAALDNLVKGMAGTAIQNLNLMCGLPETTGLWAPALRPV